MKSWLLIALITVASPVSACVTFNPSDNTYTVDENGSIKR